MQADPNHSVKISWHFPHPPTKVWQAWTDSSIAKLWFGSDPNGKVLDAKFDVRINGSFSVTFVNSDGSEFTAQGIYKEIDEPKRLIFTWGWTSPQESTELVSLQFTPDEHGTVMTFEISNIDPNTLHNYEEGWRSTFQKMGRALQIIA